ncbi:hypothetical protein GUJ93_ZPchr0010g10166 [Zizania palustris]|uniref:Uncharacterized protein n=1 Tax=Zizania palustris TaxID=103762 RepID=A0A8J5W1A1_ZIZPA|nr:hypothetical protein GUJ93_ZPchr0010g10166 [Zizania palustris]
MENLDKPHYQTRVQAKTQAMEQQLLEVTRALGVIQAQNAVIQAKVESLEEIKPSVMDLATWRPEVVKSVEDL